MSILGYKISMETMQGKDGICIPVTLLYIPHNTVSQIKKQAKDGYDAIQICVPAVRKKNFTKAEVGHLAKHDIAPGICGEFRFKGDSPIPQVGSTLNLDSCFKIGDKVDVTGISKGKGFQGVIKRHGFRLQPKTHGNTKSYRTHGSTGQRTRPGRVFPGKKMAGHMGTQRVTIQCLKIVGIQHQLLVVRGSVPGPRYGLLRIKHTIKDRNKS